MQFQLIMKEQWVFLFHFLINIVQNNLRLLAWHKEILAKLALELKPFILKKLNIRDSSGETNANLLLYGKWQS